ncbi:uncleaved alkaline protease [Sphaerosporella brunnea]|uniref:Uncleaved alkaline protease n=1 Tax=Sphaerosporella brunnea TaxID=1250544 RepID=A0A5J5F501_9PEZI|nr:uncleaved alkaline protease [Sphaerosporella brunnea]
MVSVRSLLAAAAAILPFTNALPMHSTSSNAASTQAGSIVPDHYIVVLKPNVTNQQFEEHQVWATSRHNRRLARRDDNNLTGIKNKYHFGQFTAYSGAFDASTIDEIKARDEVAHVEEDKIVVAQGIVAQQDATWGIARISHQSAPSDSSYLYDSSAGEGVTAYVIDTGVNLAHEEFEGRASFGVNTAGGDDDDHFGHGTHVSGTIAGKTFGVAKKAKIVAVKVLGDDGSGTNSGVIAGVEWVANDAQKRSGPSVANMSLGGSYSQALNSAVEAAVQSGVTFGVAAGNEGQDALNDSPASAQGAITVGATDNTDTRASFSNFGSAVDVFAPGVDITSAWIGSTTAVNTISGTSMATPHVVGLAAYLIALEGLSSPAQVAQRILALAVNGIVNNPGPSTVSSLIFNGADSSGN